MLAPSSIFFIKNYNYDDGGEPSDKLFIVLFANEDSSLLISALPTSQEKVPADRMNHGCTTNDYISFYMFEQDRNVGIKNDGTNFKFDLNTFIIFRNNIKIINTESLSQYYPHRIHYLASLDENEFTRLKNCLLKSKHLPFRIKRTIEAL